MYAGRRWAHLAVLCFMVVALAGCATSPTPSPAGTIPPAPMAPTGWTSLGSVGSADSTGFVGLQVHGSGRPLAINASCVGDGTLVVSYAQGTAMPQDQGAVLDAVVFECSDSANGQRHELPVTLGSGDLRFAGGVVQNPGSLRTPVYTLSVEEASS